MRYYLHILFFSFLLFTSSLFSQMDSSQNAVTSQQETSEVQEPRFNERDQESTEYQVNRGIREQEEPISFQARFFNMLLLLGLLVALMLIASWILKRMMKNRSFQMNRTSSITVLETRYLSAKSTLYLIEIQGEGHLIAESPTNIAYVTKVLLPSE